MSYFLQLLANGLHTGALYALLAYAYVLVHGLTQRTDLSFGAIFAFCGQTFILATGFGWNVLWMTLPAALGFATIMTFALAGLLGLAVARYVYRPLAVASPNAMLVASLGMTLFLVELARIAADNRDYWLPPILAEPASLPLSSGAVTLTQMQIIQIAGITLVILTSQYVLGRTGTGRIWRAVSDDPAAATFCGIDCGKVRTRALLAAYGLVALAGCLASLHYGSINFSTGLVFGLKILFITAVGGFQVPLHAALGGIAVGVADVLWRGYFSLLWSDAAVFILLVFLLVVRKPPQPVRL